TLIMSMACVVLLKAFTECGDIARVGIGRPVSDKPDYRHRRLLRPRREWPHRRAAEQCDELAARPHSITSSARASSVGGTSRRSASAVLRVITSSTLLACITGRSMVLAPLRMFAAYSPTWRHISA